MLQTNLQPSAPLTVTLRYQDAGVPYLDESTLDLYWWDAAAGWREAGKTCAQPDRYREIDFTTNTLTVRICRLGEFTLLGDTIRYWPLAVGKGWRYVWNNTQYAPDEVTETLWTAGKSGTDYRLRWTNPFGPGGASLSTDYGYLLRDITSSDTNPFPKPMNALVSYLGVTSEILPGQWKVGGEVSGWAYIEGVSYRTLTEIVSNTGSMTVRGHSYADCLQLKTTITGDSADYVTGTRTLWFAPNLGPIKMVYEHGDGSVTTAELSDTIILPVVRLPVVRGK